MSKAGSNALQVPDKRLASTGGLIEMWRSRSMN